MAEPAEHEATTPIVASETSSPAMPKPPAKGRVIASPTRIGLLRRAAQQARDPAARQEAIRLIHSALPDHPDAVEAYCLLARLCRDHGDAKGAMNAFRQAWARDARDAPQWPSWAYAEFARPLVQAGDNVLAEAVLRQARDVKGDAAEPALLRLLAEVLLRTGSTAPDANALIEQAVVTQPQDRLLVEAWVDRMAAGGSRDEALDRIERMQAGVTTPMRGVLLTVANARGIEHVQARFADLLAGFAATPPFAQCERVWTALCQGTTPDLADVDVVVNDRAQSPEFYFNFLRPPIQQLPLLRQDSLANEAELTALGIQAERMRRFLITFNLPGTAAWQKFITEHGPEIPEARAQLEQAEAEAGFLDRIVDTGTLTMMDPLTGDLVEPYDSVIIYGRSIYSFRGRMPFMLVAGSPWSGAFGLLIPGMNLTLTFSARASGQLTQSQISNVLATLLKRAAREAADGRPMVPAHVRSGRRRLVLSVGATENFAHHLWNFYSAIERLALTGLLDRIDRVMFSGTEFFGPLEGLFPELKRIGVEQPRRQNVIDPVPFNPDWLVLPTGGFLIPTTLSQRVIDAMGARPRARADAVEPSDITRMPGAPVIWMGLRLRDKAWAEQEEGSAEIARILSARFPGALFLLDGFSFPVGVDHVSETWVDVVEPLRAMAERIRSSSGVPDQVVNMVGNTMRESVLWAQQTDVYIAPYGSTQHKIGWFTDAPGVVYCSPNFLPQVVIRSPGAAAAEISTTPVFLHAQAASAGQRRGFNRARERFENVTLDPADLADRLTEMLEQRGFVRADVTTPLAATPAAPVPEPVAAPAEGLFARLRRLFTGR